MSGIRDMSLSFGDVSLFLGDVSLPLSDRPLLPRRAGGPNDDK